MMPFKKYTYKLRVDHFLSEDNISYVLYGITAVDVSTMQVVESIPDVFLDKHRAEDFIGLCNKLELDICHLYDVIEDEIG